MIQKLRRKIVLITMTIATASLCIIFFTMYFSSRANYRYRSIETLKSAIHAADKPKMPQKPKASGNSLPRPASPPEDRTLLLVAERKKDNTIRIIENRIYQQNPEKISSLIDQVSASGKNSGELPGQNLRYLCEPVRMDETICYAFVNIYEEQQALRAQMLQSLVIGSISFLGFFFLSLWLSQWVTAPIEENWKRQQQFVSDASHELKTPLTVILANIVLLKQSSQPIEPANQQRIEHIHSEALRMKQLTESLLLLSKNERIESAADFKPVDFSYIVNTRISYFEPLAFEMGKSISCAVEEQLFISGDEEQLARLADILLDNACKYSTENSDIHISLHRKEHHVIFTVTNEGIPFRTEEIQQIFLRFYRTDPSRSTIPGFGLGLPIARQIAANHKGNLTAGTDGIRCNYFTVSFPLISNILQKT